MHGTHHLHGRTLGAAIGAAVAIAAAVVVHLVVADDQSGLLQLIEEAHERRALDAHRLSQGILAGLARHPPDQDERERRRVRDPVSLNLRVGGTPPLPSREEKGVRVGLAELSQILAHAILRAGAAAFCGPSSQNI